MLSLPTDSPASPMLLAADLRAAAARGDLDAARAIGRALAAELAHLLANDLEEGRAVLGFLCSWHHRAEVATAALDTLALVAVAATVLAREGVTATPGELVDGRRFF